MSTFLIANPTRTVTRHEYDMMRTVLAAGRRSLGASGQ